MCALACVVLAAFVLSFFLNSMIRSRVQKAMNHELKGYHAQVAKAHFQLVDLTLTLHGVTIVQNANPKPPVGQIPFLQANLEWHDLFIGHLVGNFVIKNPTFHIDPAQLEKERTNKYSLRQEGWQDALQDIYPFKINRLRIVNARITYIPAANPNKPLYLEHFNLQAHNIRNILYPKNTYPSGIYVQSNMFGTGRFGFNGRANFLSTPFPGIRARYWMEHVPLGQLEPELKQMNITLQQGTFTSYGVLEYSPTIEKAHIYDAFINGVQIKYAHKSSTAQLETQRVREVKKGAEKLNNKPGLM
ncbi:MAG: hypothetical protein ACREP6_13995, partial [Candidatus Binataceae bacterium]